MKTKIGVALLCTLALLAGCVPTLNPIYQDDQLVFDATVLGRWEQANSQVSWDFTRRDDKSYELILTDDKGQESRFVAHLANVDGTRFLDLFPEQVDAEMSAFYKIHLVPIHTVYLVKETGPECRLAAINYNWLDKYLSEHPDEIDFASFDGRKVITASTEDLQAFLVKHKDRFTGDVVLRRTTTQVM